MSEKIRLERVSKGFTLEQGKDFKINKYRIGKIIELCKKYKAKRILDVGCADGVLTQAMTAHFRGIHAIDGSEELISRARRNCTKATFHCAMFEDFFPDGRYDMVIAGHILEHVKSPTTLLRHIRKNWLTEGGKIIVTVPNKESFHRRLGVEMGMIGDLGELSKNDLDVGHRRYFSIKTLRATVARSGFKVLEGGGIMLKPLSNVQMLDWSDEILDGLNRLSRNIPPEFCGEIYVVARS
ncbi:MAG: class I SAM-dependent methyltransferase [Methanobacteriota archaeon]